MKGLVKGTNWAIYTLIFLNLIGGGLSILPMYYIYDGVGVLNLCVGMLNILWVVTNSSKGPFLNHLPTFIICYMAVVFYQLLTGWFTFSATVLSLQFTLLLVLLNMYKQSSEGTIRVITDVYLFYSLANVVCTILCLALIITNRIDPASNILDLNTFTKSDDIAFFPGHLTVFRPKDVIRTAFIPVEGMICGFSHEPHVAGYLCIPSLFIWIDRVKSKWRYPIIMLYVVFIILTASTTSLIFLPLVFIIALLLRPDQFGKYRVVTYLILLLIIAFVVINKSFFMDNFGFFIDKAQDSGDDSSMRSSMNYLEFALQPHSLVGTNIYGITGAETNGDIGIPTAILNFVFYTSSFLFSLKMIKYKSSIVFWYGLAFLYFLLHSMKGMLLIYQYPYALLMMFMAYIVYKTYTRKRIVVDKKSGIITNKESFHPQTISI